MLILKSIVDTHSQRVIICKKNMAVIAQWIFNNL